MRKTLILTSVLLMTLQLPDAHKFNQATSSHIADSNYILDQCFRIYKPNQICVSFNGGKDITAATYLLLDYASIEQKKEIRFVYFQNTDDFPEISEFVQTFSKLNEISIITIKATTFHDGMTLLTSQYGCKAIIMGVRSTDPGTSSDLGPMQISSQGWPNFMRVYPVFEWTYSDIWEYLKPRAYCSLYDKVHIKNRVILHWGTNRTHFRINYY